MWLLFRQLLETFGLLLISTSGHTAELKNKYLRYVCLCSDCSRRRCLGMHPAGPAAVEAVGPLQGVEVEALEEPPVPENVQCSK